MVNTPTKTVVVGKIASVFGVKGWIKVISYTEPLENILNYQPWYLLNNGQAQKIELTGFEIHDKNIVVQINGCTDRDLARRYTNQLIVIDRNLLPPLTTNEYYWSDLEGMEVTTNSQKVLGKVDHVFSNGANDILVVIGEKKSLVPFLLNQTILAVDLENRKILVDWDVDF